MSSANEALFAIFAAGSGLKSPALEQVPTLQNQLSDLDQLFVNAGTSLAPEILDETQVLTELEAAQQALSVKLLNTGTTCIDSMMQALEALQSHVLDRLDKLFEEFSVASAIRSLSTYQDLPTTLHKISGSTLGDAQPTLSECTIFIEEVTSVVENLDVVEVTLLTLTEFDLLLQQALDELLHYANQITSLITQEISALNTMYSDYKQLSKAVSAQLLVNDENLSGFINQLASDDLKAALAK
ncbi:DUF7217 family protein [Marinomonas aquiplantarum]|uniref:DUF7217 domain-containing protein n=1 Tax=Marinomonas aquiplantarum TaxID=491951 RepID=A0A366D8U4_9GAMM|nr:hypothetical protein [Marinomonas aquiplantarum]RBO85919.1 hypothetical protein DFP76_101194 [Marinomonas aquiplantarum]